MHRKPPSTLRRNFDRITLALAILAGSCIVFAWRVGFDDPSHAIIGATVLAVVAVTIIIAIYLEVEDLDRRKRAAILRKRRAAMRPQVARTAEWWPPGRANEPTVLLPGWARGTAGNTFVLQHPADDPIKMAFMRDAELSTGDIRI